jgi:hypothetical protein
LIPKFANEVAENYANFGIGTLGAGFNEEYFLRRGACTGNESIAGGAEGNARVAILPAVSTRAWSGTIFP